MKRVYKALSKAKTPTVNLGVLYALGSKTVELKKRVSKTVSKFTSNILTSLSCPSVK